MATYTLAGTLKQLCVDSRQRKRREEFFEYVLHGELRLDIVCSLAPKGLYIILAAGERIRESADDIKYSRLTLSARRYMDLGEQGGGSNAELDIGSA